VSDVSFLYILTVAIGLSTDCFAVALSGSISKRTLSFLPVLRVSLSFGAFQAFMLVLGWLAGRTVIEFISAYDHWLAFALLLLVGARMIWESFRDKDNSRVNTDITKGLLLLTLSIATSIDSLAVGLSFAFLKVNIALASATIGIVAFIITVIGFLLGKKVSALMGKRAEIVGGAILIIIGIRILLAHIL
jgi:putative Mn2+ efflux pump MntP